MRFQLHGEFALGCSPAAKPARVETAFGLRVANAYPPLRRTGGLDGLSDAIGERLLGNVALRSVTSTEVTPRPGAEYATQPVIAVSTRHSECRLLGTLPAPSIAFIFLGSVRYRC